MAKRGSRDRGAAAIIVALIVPVILLLVGGLVVDVGSWYATRAEGQNAADAGALAVAESCARADAGVGACSTAYATTYDSNCLANQPCNYGNLNTAGGTARVVCGVDLANANALPSCASAPPNPCPAQPANTNFVNVQAVTVNPIGLTGSIGNQQKVAACAQARWGPPATCGDCIPLTISLCEWYQDTNNGTSFATAPTGGTYSTGSTSPYTSPPSYLDTINARRASAAYDATPGNNATNYYVTNAITDPHSPTVNSSIAGSETVLYQHTTSGFGASCNTGSDNSNQTAPGQFGWLNETGTCTASIGPTYPGQTGSHSPSDCGPVFTASRNNITPVYLPVYTSVTGNGANTSYTLAGFAAFVVTGWGGLNQTSPSSCDSLVTEQDASTSIGGDAANNSCTSVFGSGHGHGHGGATDYADYCSNYVGANNCNGNSTQTLYGYFTKALIPASDLPSGSGNGTNLGLSSVSLSG